jgi:hypothetical protein
LRHNRIQNQQGETSAIMIGADLGSINGVLIENNMLSGGDYALYGGAQPPAGNTIANIVIRNNVFTTEFFKDSGQYGAMIATNDKAITVSNNVWASTGTAV